MYIRLHIMENSQDSEIILLHKFIKIQYLLFAFFSQDTASVTHSCRTIAPPTICCISISKKVYQLFEMAFCSLLLRLCKVSWLILYRAHTACPKFTSFLASVGLSSFHDSTYTHE